MMPAIAPHSTATTDASWDGPAAKANLKNDGDAAYYRKAFAWSDPDGDEKTKAAYKFIHHMVSSGGDIGAANTTACSSGIAVLNGGRGGTKIPDSDRKGVWNHLAKHLKDADKEPPPLSSWDDYIAALEAANKTPMPLAMQFISDDRPWAITPLAIHSLLEQVRTPDFEALAARVGQPLANGYGRDVENHNGTAVLDIRGPLFRYRSIFTWLLGGTAVEDTAIGLHAALDDPSVKSIVLAINSPGGQIDGINELANMIRTANAQKPITAYVDALAGSGAYWLASAAGRIVADETAQLGSIGVLATVIDDSDADQKRGVKRYDVISSQSPLKRTDPATDEGRAQLQQMVDGMAQTFIERVAAFRGTSVERVQSEFGRGAVLPARSAIAVGMADALGSLEGLIQRGDAAPVRDIRDKPGLRVGKLPSGTVVSATLDENELEKDTEDQKLNDDYSCTCPPDSECTCGAAKNGDDEDEDGDEDDNGKDNDQDEDDDDESNGTEQRPDTSSIPQGLIPEGESDLIKPNTEDRQRIAAILTCEEAHGRDELARMLALETNHSVEAARKLLQAAPVATKPNALEARMAQIKNPQVGVAPDAVDNDSPAAEVAKILAFVPQNRLRAHAKHVQ